MTKDTHIDCIPEEDVTLTFPNGVKIIIPTTSGLYQELRKDSTTLTIQTGLKKEYFEELYDNTHNIKKLEQAKENAVKRLVGKCEKWKKYYQS